MSLEWKYWTEEFILERRVETRQVVKKEKQSKKDFRKFIENKMKKRGKKK